MKTRSILAAIIALGCVPALGCTEVVRTPKQAHDTFEAQVTQHLDAIRACYERSTVAKTHSKRIATVKVTLGDTASVWSKNDMASDSLLTNCIVSVLNNSKTPLNRGEMDWGGLADGEWTFVYDPAQPAIAATPK